MIINLNAINWIQLCSDEKSVDVRMQDGRYFTDTEHFWALYLALSNQGNQVSIPYSVKKLSDGVYIISPLK